MVKNKLSKLCKITIFAVLIFVLCNKNAHADLVHLQHREVYQIYYVKQDSALVNSLLIKLDKKILEIENFFQFKPKSLISIYLTKSEEEFQSYARSGFPEWAQAIAFPKQGNIVIRVANADEQLRLPQVLLHELVHVYIGIRFPDAKIPTWLHEGLAQRLSQDNLDMDEKIQIANALYSDNLTALSELDSLFQFSRLKVQLAYALSRSAIDFFLNEYSQDQLFNIFIELNKKNSINDTFKKITGKDFIDFEVGWFSYIDEEYEWMILLNVENLLWLLVIILFFAAFLRIKIKNKRTIKNWPEKDISGESELIN